MGKHPWFFGAVCCVLSCVLSFRAEASTQDHLVDIDNQLNSLDISPLQLSLQGFLNSLPSRNTLLVQRQSLQEIGDKLKSVESTNLCEALLHRRLNWLSKNASERVDLSLGYLQHKARYHGRFQDLPDGPQWYRHWLNSWLEQDVNVKQLIDVAKKEADDTFKQLESFPSSEQMGSLLAEHQQQIVTQFRLRESTVRQHFSEVFNPALWPRAFNIARSQMPASFPAPGYYNQHNATFYFHPQGQQFHLQTADWLFLHEAVPGHHMQGNLPPPSFCQTPHGASFLIAEGWGSYVETLGKQLGLYQQTQSERYALKWQLLRAVRVLVDTGLHVFGWSDTKAREVFTKYIPNEPDVVERELQRIKDWPAQVNTYVYGKYLIQQAKTRLLTTYPDASLVEIHDGLFAAMAFGVQGLIQVVDVPSTLTKTKKD